MSRRAPALVLGAGIAAVALPGVAAAQFSVAQPAAYLLTTDAADGRAIWVNPGALTRRQEASVGVHVSLDRRAGGTELSEYGVTLASGPVGLGWQKHERADGYDYNAYTAGLGVGDARISAGFARRWFNWADRNSSAWDVGVRYQPSPLLEAGVVWRDIGDPVIRDSIQKSVVVPGAAFTLLGGRLRVGGEADVVADGGGTSEIRAGSQLVLSRALSVRVRGTFTADFGGRDLAVALEWNGPGARLVGFGAALRTPDVERVGVAGMVIAPPPRGRFSRP